jgi:prepilin-type N-terminal cleavage/methylation domain-containing protein/prepilin-type processing-associated H-X9-DG protein
MSLTIDIRLSLVYCIKNECLMKLKRKIMEGDRRALAFKFKYQRGFSLVELLVVIAILALLLSLLFPVVNSVLHQSRVSSDMSNLRSLQTAHFNYAIDSEGRFADAGLSHGGLANEDIAWLNSMKDHGADIDKIIRSPLDKSPFWDIPIEGTSDRFRRTSYGWNNFLSRTHSPDAAIDPQKATDRISRVKHPASVIHFLPMAWSGSFAGADHVHVENWWVNDSLPDAPPVLAANQVQTNVVSGEAGSPSAKANYGFVDGHVETLSFSETYNRPDRNQFDPKINSFLQ